jgi:hypothetical protein
MSRIFPSWKQINSLRVPLTEGERALAEFLDNHLPDAWSIYVQPYLNDMRPDVVVRNPRIGMVVFEVKDWTLGRYRFEHGRMIAQTNTRRWIEADPVHKVWIYARGLYEQFLISDEAVLDFGKQPNDLVLCCAAVYFHKASTEQAKTLYAGYSGRVFIFGTDTLTETNIDHIVPFARKEKANFVRDEQHKALEKAHFWLVPPRHAVDQQQPTPLTRGQAQYAKPEKGFRRIRGVAGSGKSFVLSHRAARANQEGRRVLLLSFNITMSHILRDLLIRAPYEVDWDRVTWSHFHGWAKKQATEAGITDEAELPTYDDSLIPPDDYDSTNSSWNERLTRALEGIVGGNELAMGYERPRYGGIYIDEGQDFDPRWLDALAEFLADDGELVLFADHKQNLYAQDGGRDIHRTMRRCRFSGPWAQLPQKSHRLPWRIALFLNDFAQETRLGDEEDLLLRDYAERPPQSELPLDRMAWRNVQTNDESLDSMDDALSYFSDPNPGDVIVLVPTHDLGLKAVKRLSARFRQIVHIFSEGGPQSPESRRRKAAFWMGRGGLKMCTIHSFKGWELDNVILIWPPDNDLQHMSALQRASLFYTGVSRAMRNLIVLNANLSYAGFSRDWDTLPPIQTNNQ